MLLHEIKSSSGKERERDTHKVCVSVGMYDTHSIHKFVSFVLTRYDFYIYLSSLTTHSNIIIFKEVIKFVHFDDLYVLISHVYTHNVMLFFCVIFERVLLGGGRERNLSIAIIIIIIGHKYKYVFVWDKKWFKWFFSLFIWRHIE